MGIAAAADSDNVADAEPAPGPAAEVRELPTVAAPTYGDLTASTSVDDDADDEDDCSAAAVESSPSATDGSRAMPPPLSENEAESAAAIACPPTDADAEEAEEGVGDATFVRAVGHDSSGDADDDEDEEVDRGEVDEEEEEEDESGAEAEAVSTGDEADGGWYGGPEAERADDEDADDDEDDDDADDEACLAAMALRTARMSTEANGCDMPIASTASDSALAADTRPLESTRMR